MSSIYEALTKAGNKSESTSVFTISSQGIRIEWKIIIAVVGLVFVFIVNQLVGHVLRTQMHESAVIMTTNLSDAAASYLASKNVLQLNTTVAKYARLSRVAYVFIQDREGQVIAHSLETFAANVQQEVSFLDNHVSRQELTFQGKTVYETREPILEGRLGSAHIAIWADAVERDIYRALFTFLWPVALGLLAALIIAVILARPLIQALRRAIELRLGSHASSTRP